MPNVYIISRPTLCSPFLTHTLGFQDNLQISIYSLTCGHTLFLAVYVLKYFLHAVEE